MLHRQSNKHLIILLASNSSEASTSSCVILWEVSFPNAEGIPHVWRTWAPPLTVWEFHFRLLRSRLCGFLYFPLCEQVKLSPFRVQYKYRYFVDQICEIYYKGSNRSVAFHCDVFIPKASYSQILCFFLFVFYIHKCLLFYPYVSKWHIDDHFGSF